MLYLRIGEFSEASFCRVKHSLLLKLKFVLKDHDHDHVMIIMISSKAVSDFLGNLWKFNQSLLSSSGGMARSSLEDENEEEEGGGEDEEDEGGEGGGGSHPATGSEDAEAEVFISTNSLRFTRIFIGHSFCQKIFN